MPSYTFTCPDCSVSFDRIYTFTQYDAVKAGEHGILCDCGGSCSPVFNPGDLAATFKEGESGGWASKSAKEKRNRARRWVDLGQKKKDHVKPQELVPNLGGVVHDRWSDIQDHVRSTAGAEAASSYDSFVKKETGKLHPCHVS